MKRITFILMLSLSVLIGSNAQTTNLLFINALAFQQVDKTDKVSDEDNLPKFILSGNELTAKNIKVGTQIDIYSVLGAKVFSFIYNGDTVNLDLNKGIYIIKANRYTQKILLQ